MFRIHTASSVFIDGQNVIFFLNSWTQGVHFSYKSTSEITERQISAKLKCDNKKKKEAFNTPNLLI